MTGAPGPSHLGTWETMNPMRANSERLAAPQVLADDFLSRAHNRSNRKCEAYRSTIQFPTRAILLLFPVSSPKNIGTLPPYLVENVFLTRSSLVT